MNQDFVHSTLDRVVQTKTYTAIVLQAQKTRFAIFTATTVGKFLQAHLSGETRQRPHTSDLISSLMHAYDIHVKQVVINDVQDTIFYAKLFLEMTTQGSMRHIVEMDTRPSDSLTLAVVHNAPIFCTQKVLENVVPFVE